MCSVRMTRRRIRVRVGRPGIRSHARRAVGVRLGWLHDVATWLRRGGPILIPTDTDATGRRGNRIGEIAVLGLSRGGGLVDPLPISSALADDAADDGAQEDDSQNRYYDSEDDDTVRPVSTVFLVELNWESKSDLLASGAKAVLSQALVCLHMSSISDGESVTCGAGAIFIDEERLYVFFPLLILFALCRILAR